MKIFTISAKARHGKDLTAQIMKEKLETVGKKVFIVHYGDYVKYVCKEYFGWDGQKDEKGRTILQRIGTDVVRAKHPDFWVETVERLINVFQDDFDYFIIPDCRFQNEVEYLRDKGYNVTAFKVIRLNFESELTEEQKRHPSETALDDYIFDVYFECESGKENVEKAVNAFIEKEIVSETI